MLLVDTSVWSLAPRRRRPVASPHVDRFREALTTGEVILTGIVMQELLQNLGDGNVKEGIVTELDKLPLLVPERGDHRVAAEVYTTCRRRGVQVGTVDALIAALCLRRDLDLLSTDRDFEHMARFTELKLWDTGTASPPE